MIIKRTEVDTIEMKNGTTLHCYDDIATEKELKAAMEDADKAYTNNPTMSNKLYRIYAKADCLYAKGDRKSAIKYLDNELEMIHDLDNNPETLLKWLDANSLMAEMLIREKDLDKCKHSVNPVFAA